MTGWLAEQLPDILARDPLVRAFAGAGEALADSVRSRIDGLEYFVDIDYADAAMLAYLGSWLGLALDPRDDTALQRSLLRAMGSVLPRRGTKAELVVLLEAMTGERVEVEDGGGVYGPGDHVPAYDSTVRARLREPGLLGRERLAAILMQELPVGVSLELDFAETPEGAADVS